MIHSNERNMHWGFNVLYCLVHRDNDMSLNKTDSCIQITQLRLVDLLFFHRWCVCYMNYYCVMSHCKTMQPSVVHRPVVG